MCPTLFQECCGIQVTLVPCNVSWMTGSKKVMIAHTLASSHCWRRNNFLCVPLNPKEKSNLFFSYFKGTLTNNPSRNDEGRKTVILLSFLLLVPLHLPGQAIKIVSTKIFNSQFFSLNQSTNSSQNNVSFEMYIRSCLWTA